jgi:putative transposase
VGSRNQNLNSARVKQRLRRLDRLYLRSPIHFVTACTAARRHILSNPDVHVAFTKFAERGSDHGAWIGRYVLMPDHLHAFVALDDERLDLSTWMKSLKNMLSKTLREIGVPTPHWQKGFFDHVLRTEESASSKWNYVRDNPVRAGLVRNWEEWPYSRECHQLEYKSEHV